MHTGISLTPPPKVKVDTLLHKSSFCGCSLLLLVVVVAVVVVMSGALVVVGGGGKRDVVRLVSG